MSTLEYNPNSPEAMLYAYVDGELQPEMDSELFGHLSTNSALRTEMRELLAIRRGIQDDTVVAPLALPGNILAAAGLPALTGAVGTAVGYGLKALLTSVVKPIAFTVLGALISWGGITYYNSQNTQTTTAQNQGNTIQQEHIETPFVATAPAAETPAIKNDSYSTEIRNYSLTSKPVAPQVVYVIADNNNQKPLDFIQHNDNNNTTTDYNSATISTVQEQGSFALPQPTNIQDGPSIIPTTISNASPTSMLLLANQEPSLFDGVQIRLRSLYTLGTTSTVGNQQNEQHILENSAASLLFGLSKNWVTGLEIGREQFTQEFTGTENGITANYKQTPRLMWVGLHGEYVSNPIQSLYGIQPVIGGTIGMAGGLYGMARSQFGLQYAPADNVRFLLGVEGTGLTYQFQNKPYVSLKWGLTYGVSVRF